MPHKCVRCSSIYPNNSPELMRGCTCGSRVFLFLRDESTLKGQKTAATVSSSFTPADSTTSSSSLSESSPSSTPSTSSVTPSNTTPSDADSSASSSPASASSLSDYGWLEDELAFLSKDKPVSVDVDAVENLRILEKGAYEIDLPSLMKGEPLVIKSDQHVYYVKLPHPRK